MHLKMCNSLQWTEKCQLFFPALFLCSKGNICFSHQSQHRLTDWGVFFVVCLFDDIYLFLHYCRPIKEPELEIFAVCVIKDFDLFTLLKKSSVKKNNNIFQPLC